jgi:transcriptional regulator with XRE-family HTH domain
MTQHELARAARMPQSTVARIEAGAAVPRTSTLMELLRATGHDLRVEPTGNGADLDIQPLRLRPAERTRRALGRVARNRRTSPTDILRRLRRFNVPFVLIGQLAEVAHGATTPIQRVEVVVADTDIARERLAMVNADMKSLPEGLLVDGTAAGDGYDVLARTARPMLVDVSLRVQVASLEDLILARHAGRTDDDRAAEATLRSLASATSHVPPSAA